MKAILADADIQGHWRVILTHLDSAEWREIWVSLGLKVETFASLGLAIDAPDRLIWELCQERETILLTNNRNQEGPDSLEATLRAHNTATSLPVFTLASAERILHSKDYADRVAEQLLRYLLDIDNIRGTGRLYLP